jgi:predicted protein tyrosine phosphatase
MLHVCSLARLPGTVAATRARHVVTLIDAGTPVVRPHPVPAENHLFLGVNDIVAPAEGLVLPDESHVDALIGFVERWGRSGPMVIHCFAGISRSTAAAFIAACSIDPNRAEIEIANALRLASPSATPNARLVALADARLGRRGRMIAAVAAIGRGREALEGEPFRLATERALP